MFVFILYGERTPIIRTRVRILLGAALLCFFFWCDKHNNNNNNIIYTHTHTR